MKTIAIVIAFLFLAQRGWSQLHDYENYHHEDSLHHVESIKGFFLQGKFHGHVRNSFMGTVNNGMLKDYFANATGGALSYETAILKGFELGIKGIFTYNVWSTDLNQKDTLAHQSAKWEKELFDVTRPEEKKDLDRLEELYIKYHFKNSFVTIGKIDINQGPLLLRRDGRMKPFVYKGLWSELGMLKHHTFNVGWIYGVSPRGMTEWFSLKEAIGMLNNGHQPNGQPAHYHETTHTKGMLVLGYRGQLKNFKIQFWDHYLHQMFNTSWLQIDYEGKILLAGIQYVNQFADAYQRKLAYTERIFQPGATSNTLSVQLGAKVGNSGVKISGAYLRGMGGGERFVYPKVLSRENFYVSQPRSWIDGFGRVDVMMLRLYYRPVKEQWNSFSLDTRFERVHTTGEDDFANNKYGMPSYFQSTTLIKYAFKNKLEGLNLIFLSVFKFTENAIELDHLETFYRTDLFHFNLILNINF